MSKKKNMPHVNFYSKEPSDSEYFEEYDKYNSVTNPWFILIFILRSLAPLCLGLQTGIFEYPKSVELYMKEFSISHNSTEIFFAKRCPDVEKKQSIKNSQFEGSYDPSQDKCNQENVVLQMTLFKSIGFSIGSIIGGILSDIYGRRNVCLYSSIFWFILSWTIVFITNITLLEITYVLIVTCSVIVNLVTLVTFGETANRWNRFLVVYTIPTYVIGDGFMYFAAPVLIWRCLLIFISLTMSLVVFASWYIPEPARWLLNKNKRKEAYDQLNEISGLIYNIEASPPQPQAGDNPESQRVFCEMFNYLTRFKILKHFLILCTSMVIASVNYNAAKLKAVLHYVHTDDYRLLANAAEAMGFLFFIPIYIVFGKKIGLLSIYGGLAVESLIIMFAYDKYEEIYYNMFRIMFGIAAMNINWLFYLEMFPTFLRATATGVGFCIFGTVTASCTFLSHNQILSPFNSNIILLALSIVGGLVFLLPNVDHQNLPNSKIR